MQILLNPESLFLAKRMKEIRQMTKTDNIIGKARYKRARQSKFVVKVKIKDCNN